MQSHTTNMALQKESKGCARLHISYDTHRSLQSTIFNKPSQGQTAYYINSGSSRCTNILDVTIRNSRLADIISPCHSTPIQQLGMPLRIATEALQSSAI